MKQTFIANNKKNNFLKEVNLFMIFQKITIKLESSYGLWHIHSRRGDRLQFVRIGPCLHCFVTSEKLPKSQQRHQSLHGSLMTELTVEPTQGGEAGRTKVKRRNVDISMIFQSVTLHH